MTKRKTPKSVGAQAFEQRDDDERFEEEFIVEGDHKARDGRRIKLVPFDEIKIGTDPPSLVQGLIPRVGITVVWGPPKSGKSFWTFDVCMHVALGWDYRGRRVQRGPIIYCAFEGQTGIRLRTAAFRQELLSEQAEGIPFYLQPCPLELVRDHKELIEAIHETLGDIKPVAVVLDTLNRSLGGSESRDEDMGAYIRAADTIRETFNCAVIVVHHCGVDDRRPRGHTSLAGAADAQIAIKKDTDNIIFATLEALKDGSGEGDVIASQLEKVELGEDSDGLPIGSCIVVPVEISATTKKKKEKEKRVTGAAGVALKILKRAVSGAGEIPPACNHIPPNVRAVKAELWRKYCYEGSVADPGAKQDAKQKAFIRAVKHLQNIEAIGMWGEWVWPA